MNLGWIDFSDSDRKKTMDVLRLFQEQGAVDELGIGVIRDGFANYFSWNLYDPDSCEILLYYSLCNDGYSEGYSCILRPTGFAPFGRIRERICCHFKEK